jgi:hypothetical protein
VTLSVSHGRVVLSDCFDFTPKEYRLVKIGLNDVNVANSEVLLVDALGGCRSLELLPRAAGGGGRKKKNSSHAKFARHSTVTGLGRNIIGPPGAELQRFRELLLDEHETVEVAGRILSHKVSTRLYLFDCHLWATNFKSYPANAIRNALVTEKAANGFGQGAFVAAGAKNGKSTKNGRVPDDIKTAIVEANKLYNTPQVVVASGKEKLTPFQARVAKVLNGFAPGNRLEVDSYRPWTQHHRA